MALPQEVFQKHDVNKDGKMSSKELKAALKELDVDVTPILIEGIMAQYDKAPHNGSLELDEFQNLVLDMHAITKAKLEKTLDVFTKTYDKDGSGFISRDELKEGMGKLGIENSDATVEVIAQVADVNGDGKISVKEFAAAVGYGESTAV